MAQMLETIIAINAQVGNGFSQVGATLTELGSMVNGTSQQLINFGKESTNVYRVYEKSMKDAEVALSTIYGRSTKELTEVMAQLDVSATEWAATTIFHTNDVANAISEASHAGWNLDQILNGIPAAMQLAQAGSLDLSEAVNYIVKASNAAGTGFEDLGTFIDLWAFAANSSASTIGEFGEAMLRMGSTMRFAGDTEELMTLIAVTANAGATGEEAGTMIRNSLIRLIAPTDKAQEAMALLGATSIETSAILDDEAMAAANARLAATGFSAFDEDGQMKHVLDVYRELYVALGEIAGGYDSIDRNKDALSILSTIFPTRTITEALTLLRGAADGYNGLYEAMRGGDALGYGAYSADTMMATLDGKIESFGSKVERLKQLVGEELSGQLTDALDGIGDIVDNIAEMDEDKFSALVAGLEVIAGVGPSLLIAGTAFRLIGFALTPAGGIGLGLTALAAAAAAIEKLEDADFAKAFGAQELDSAAIQSYVQTLGEDFKGAYTEVDKFRGAVDASVESYKTASETFTSNLLTTMLTGATVTPEQIKMLEGLGADMYSAVNQGIVNSTKASTSYWQMLFSGEKTGEFDQEYLAIMDLTNQAYENAIGQATTISQGLRDAMTSAFEDGEVTDEEYREILNWTRAYNEAIARATSEAKSEQDYVNQQMLFRRAQTAGLDEIKTVAGEITTERDRVLSEAEENYWRERYALEYRWDQAIANGDTINGVTATDEGKSRALAAAEEKYNQHVLTQGARYDDILYKLWDSQIRQSDYADAYEQLDRLAENVLSGTVSPDDAVQLFMDQFGGTNEYAGQYGWGSGSSTRTRLAELLARQIAGYGGYEGLQARINDYSARGDEESAEKLRKLYAMQQINDNFAKTGILEYKGLVASILGEDSIHSSSAGDYAQLRAGRDDFLLFLNGLIPEYSTDLAKKTVGAFSGDNGQMDALFAAIGQSAEAGSMRAYQGALDDADSTTIRAFEDMIANLSAVYDFAKVRADSDNFMAQDGNTYNMEYAAWQLLYGEASKNPEKYKIPLAIDPNSAGEDSLGAFIEQGVDVKVHGDTKELRESIDAFNGSEITVNVHGQKMYANGGRATSASVFAEAGPEWAIPEAHSERTAQLLDAARAASGFTWPDILSRFGGLNANPINQPTTLVYSPTVHAADATGVDAVLMEDKKRLDRWYADMKLRDELEVYG